MLGYCTSLLKKNEQGLRINLDVAAMKNEAYKYHNARVKNMTFKQGDLVPRKLEATGSRESKGKLASK